ncbi:Rossmann-like and DUF2520 domain-containing protein [Flavobacterium aquicola]|uniref:Putative short-subunit dehydrogenase-like oxidoreductase (DUF2520 family) n=1 Tax=Flavobacterium aquicola TaxID=1682742 RepID=A0A3E0EEH2_9FLAO|nr:Rossmann-like and DUF2520 domain-containing protein [Flavobacterium aquicola]REG96133.1 putative short-subunit dehydrogenase-like oxidoreductase (DUF2520 family) [Flavobacterium aquicola]
MIKITIIGSGNVAQHLIEAFAKSDAVEIIQVFSRNPKQVIPNLDSSKITNDWNALAEADLYIISVSDDAITDVSSQLPFENRLVVHTSGSAPLAALNSKNRKGVFYPLQTFTKGKPIDFKTVPFCLETESENDYTVLEKAAVSISDNVKSIDSHQRKALHVAAVFVNNFTNYLYQLGNDICQENHVSFDILKPLILETAEKLLTLSPKDAQTGPAKRNDISTIAAHESFLSNENQSAIYKILTQSIQNHGKKL